MVMLAITMIFTTIETSRAGALTTAPVAFARDAPDPTVVFNENDNYYYAFTTQAVTPSGFAQIPMWRSRDLVSWTYVGNALAHKPAWMAVGGATVAPSVVFTGGRWTIYFAALATTGEMCIGYATAVALPAAFDSIDSRPMRCGIDDGNGAIDPSVFVNQSGDQWLLWKNEGSAQIMSQRLSSDGRRLIGSPTNIYNPDQPWVGLGAENPEMVQVDGLYYLFFSYNYWESADYATGMARCESPSGPCHGIDTLLRSSGTAVGPGGMTTFRSAANDLLVAYHGWVGGVGYQQGGRRELFVAALAVDGDHEPKLAAGPFGSIDLATINADGQATLYGWALNRAVDGPVSIHVYVDGRLVAGAAADQSRTDVGRAYAVSDEHGFAISTKPGRICLYLIDDHGGPNPLLGCRDVGLLQPVGSLDLIETQVDGVRVAGWAYDPDTPVKSSIVRAYVDGALATESTAARRRTDVAAVHPTAGDRHGFDMMLTIGKGRHQVCVYATNSGLDSDQRIACRTIDT